MVPALRSEEFPMKKFLLTWYGLTDFRASLGFENTIGPIAGALEAEDYCEVVILCYTRTDDETDKHAGATVARDVAAVAHADRRILHAGAVRGTAEQGHAVRRAVADVGVLDHVARRIEHVDADRVRAVADAVALEARTLGVSNLLKSRIQIPGPPWARSFWVSCRIARSNPDTRPSRVHCTAR